MEPASNPLHPETPAAPSNPGQVIAPGASAAPYAEALTITPPPYVSASIDRPVAVASGIPSNDVFNGSSMSLLEGPKKGLRDRLGGKKVLMAAGAAFLLLSGGASAYFGYYVPNKPENVWKTALTNTGKGYDKLSEYAQQQLDSKQKGVKIDGSFKLSGSVAADGSFQGSSDGDNGEFTGSLSATGLKMNLDTRVIKSATGDTPDIYFKVDGLQGIGTLFGGSDPQVEKALNGLNGNWYFVDHTLFDQYAKGANSDLQFSQKDIKPVLDGVGKAAKQYVFTNNSSQMAFTVKEQIGKEKQDGRNVYHYKVGVNKNNLKAFNNALCDNLKDSKLFKAFYSSAGQTLSECKDTSDLNNIKESETADVWVDLHTRLIHKIRFTDKDNKDSYFDVGQDYQGGDSFPFNFDFHSKTNSGGLKITLNTKSNTLDFDGSAKSSDKDGAGGSFKMTISPNSSAVKVEKPANAKTIIELLNDLGFGDIFGQVQSSAKDTERKTDINALHGHMEAVYAFNGYYPAFSQVNDQAWRAVNMKGLDDSALQDPEGSAKSLGAKPGVHVYSYEVSPAGCNNTTKLCADYTLTATLDDGSAYAKKALNFDSGFPNDATVIQN
ncbi:hypothetical protein KW794_00855 [Candidatus Saccharibacteria bacterium]|nr:hypothetical protein [Candidatus Saccharibacteria bacterium]